MDVVRSLRCNTAVSRRARISTTLLLSDGISTWVVLCFFLVDLSSGKSGKQGHDARHLACLLDAVTQDDGARPGYKQSPHLPGNTLESK